MMTKGQRLARTIGVIIDLPAGARPGVHKKAIPSMEATRQLKGLPEMSVDGRRASSSLIELEVPMT